MRLLGAFIIIIPILSYPLVFNKKDLLAPINLFSLIYLVTILIPTIIFSDLNNVQIVNNYNLRAAISSDSIYLKYCVLQTICYYLVLFGSSLQIKRGRLIINRISKPTTTLMVNNLVNSKDNSNYLFYGVLFTIVGFLSFLMMMTQVGGIYYFFTHLQYRAFLTRDLDLLSWLLPLLQFGPLLIVYSLKDTHKSLNIPLILLILLAGFCSGLGGRKAVILLLFETFIIYHFCVKNIKIKDYLKPKYVLLLFVVTLFFAVYVQFRTEGAFEQFLDNPLLFIKSNNRGLVRMFTSETYVPFYMMVLDHFDNHPLWMGSSYLGLLTAIIPSSLYSGKPPVDDGMYLYSICQGRLDVKPIMSTYMLDGSSYPLETFGSSYSNFGMVGLFIGMILLGVVYGYVYRQIYKHNFDYLWLILYAQIIFGFQFSTLRMFQLFQIFIMAYLINGIIKRFPLKKDKG